MCIDHIDIISTPVNQLTIDQAHKQYNSLVDKIAVKYQQLDSSKFEAVGTPGFNAKSIELASLFACMSQLCQRLHLPMPTQVHKLTFFKHRRALFRSKFICKQTVLLCGGCSFIPTHIRITGLLSTFSF